MKVRFGAFTIDTGARQLTRGRAPVHLSPKAFDLLALLVERRPEAVDKAAIRDRLWPAVHVVDTTLSNLVVEIRAALNDRAGVSACVRTVHGVGYAFAAEAVDAAAPSAGDSPKTTPFWLVWNERPIVLPPGEAIVGRDASCEVWIDASGVSRRHARLRVPQADVDEAVTIEDLGSTNGTLVRGRRIGRAQALDNGDRIRLGDATLVFRAAGPLDRTRKVGRRKA
jgi:DNA-binding winged helix-turn-helix (wHTH) protein